LVEVPLEGKRNLGTFQEVEGMSLEVATESLLSCVDTLLKALGVIHILEKVNDP
jgi:hypothetical protein